MSGHSKWHNIARKKGVVDQQRAKVFTKFAREMAVVIRTGGTADPSVNGKLRDVIAILHKYPPAVIQNGFAKVQRL